MVKILGIISAVSALCAYFLFSMYTNSQKEIAVLETEKNSLTNIVKGYQNAEVEANHTIRQLRNQIRDNQKNTDWYNTPIPAELLSIMQERHNRSRKN